MMASVETTCKVNFVGVWYEDSFTDDVMKTIAAYSHVEKGKKVKFTINKIGIKISKSKMFQQSMVEFYPYDQMKAIMKNPRFSNCVMLIMDGKDKKYKILALRCPSDTAIYIVNRVSQFRENPQTGNFTEMKKQVNGNWTLRERSAHNANRHISEFFKEQQEKSNAAGETLKVNGDVHHVPILDRSKEPAVRNNAYIKRNGTVTRDTVVVQSDDQTGEIHVVQDEGIKDEEDFNDLMQHVKIADALDGGSRRGSMLPSKPEVDTATSGGPNSGPLVLRATSASSRRTVTSGHPDPHYYYATTTPNSNNNNNNQWAAHRRVSGDFVLPPRLDRKYSSGTASMRSSGRSVQFDSGSIVSVSVPRKSSSMRMRSGGPATLSIPTTIERSIENTYARPVIVQQQHPHHQQQQQQQQQLHQQPHRRGSGNAYIIGSRSKRPSSIHVMGRNDLKVYQQGYSGEAL